MVPSSRPVVLDSDVVSLLWVAACCTANRMPLLTRNRKDFEPMEDYGLILL
jgi:predicted nucleic acid-binding protein